MVQQVFMNFGDTRRSIFAFNLVNDCFVIICEAIKKNFNLVFMIHRFAENGESIQTRRDTFNVFVNCLRDFGVFLSWSLVV